MPELQQYHKNFITGVKLVMAVANLETTKDAAEYLGIPYQGLWKIMDGTNKPSVDNCIKLLNKGRYSANWLFLNKGEKYMHEQATLNDVLKAVKQLS